MANNKISTMSFKEIEEKFGILVYGDQIVTVLKNEYFDDKVEIPINKNSSVLEIIDYIEENFDKIDRERLVLCTGLNLRGYFRNKKINEDMINIDNASELLTDLEYMQKYQNIQEVIRKSIKTFKCEVPELSYLNGIISIDCFVDANLLLGIEESEKDKERRKYNYDLLKNIQTGGYIAVMINLSTNKDFEDFSCVYSGNGKYFDYVTKSNAQYIYNSIMDDGKINDIIDDNAERQMIGSIGASQVQQMLFKFPEKFDIETIMLVTAYRAKDLLEHADDLEETEREELVDYMRYVEEKLEELGKDRIKFSGLVYDRVDEERKYTDYSFKKLREDNKRIVNNIYYSNDKILKIREMLLNGEGEISDTEENGIYDLLKLTERDKKKILQKNPNSMKTFLNMDDVSQEEMREYIDNGLLGDYRFSGLDIDYLFANGIVNRHDLIQMYLDSNIELAKMVDCDSLYEINSEITVEELVKRYSEMEKDDSKTKYFDKYALLFREIKLKNKSPEEQSEVVDEMVEEIYKLDNEYDAFKTIYKSNILPIETLVEWNGEDIIYDLVSESALKPKDAKTLLVSGQLDIARIKRILMNSGLSDSEKINFIYSTFDGIGKNEEEEVMQRDAREELMQSLNGNIGKIEYQKGASGGFRYKHRGGQKGNQYVSDPMLRWKMFHNLDEDCTSEIYSRTEGVFTLPNLNGGTVIIEKLFKNTKDGTIFNYGNATYIMSLEDFYSYKQDIIKNDRIDTSTLVELKELGIADKKVHSKSWGREIKSCLRITPENNYSDEKIEEIDSLVEKIEQARELMK